MVQRERGGSDEDKWSDYTRGFALGPEDTLESVLALMDEVAAETEAVINGITDLTQPVPVPKGVPWYPQDLEAWTVRWVLLHIVEEAAGTPVTPTSSASPLTVPRCTSSMAGAEKAGRSPHGSSPGNRRNNPRFDAPTLLP